VQHVLAGDVAAVAGAPAGAGAARPTGASHQPERAGRLLWGPLSGLTVARFAAGIVGSILLPLFLLVLAGQDEPDVGGAAIVAAVALGLTVFSELAGRQIFFRAQTAPRMPGMPQ
jgi:hypothetical protein